jgi:ABC-type multidrug transport system permease subunit
MKHAINFFGSLAIFIPMMIVLIMFCPIIVAFVMWDWQWLTSISYWVPIRIGILAAIALSVFFTIDMWKNE